MFILTQVLGWSCQPSNYYRQTNTASLYNSKSNNICKFICFANFLWVHVEVAVMCLFMMIWRHGIGALFGNLATPLLGIESFVSKRYPNEHNLVWKISSVGCMMIYSKYWCFTYLFMALFWGTINANTWIPESIIRWKATFMRRPANYDARRGTHFNDSWDIPEWRLYQLKFRVLSWAMTS